MPPGAFRAGFSPPSCARVTASGRRWRLTHRARQKAQFSVSPASKRQPAAPLPRSVFQHSTARARRHTRAPPSLLGLPAKNSSLPGTARSRVRHSLCRQPATVPDGCAVGGRHWGGGSGLSLVNGEEAKGKLPSLCCWHGCTAVHRCRAVANPGRRQAHRAVEDGRGALPVRLVDVLERSKRQVLPRSPLTCTVMSSEYGHCVLQAARGR